MRTPTQGTGFEAPAGRTLGHEHNHVALASLIASAALAFATVVLATVVSVGIARADVVGNVIDNEGGLFAIALLLGLLFIGMSGLTVLSLPHRPKKAGEFGLGPCGPLRAADASRRRCVRLCADVLPTYDFCRPVPRHQPNRHSARLSIDIRTASFDAGRLT